MKRFIIPALVLLAFSAKAQKNPKQPIDYKRAVSFSPLLLIGPDFTLLGGYEFRLKDNLVFSPEAGPILGSAYYSNGNNGRGAYGFMVRPSLKFFVNPERSFYMQPQLFYKMVDNRLHDWVGKDCVEDVPAYEELKDFTYRRHAFGFNVIGGILVPNKSRRLIFDFYLGFGMRRKISHVVGDSNDCYDGGGAAFGTGEENGTYPNVPAGVRLLFVIR